MCDLIAIIDDMFFVCMCVCDHWASVEGDRCCVLLRVVVSSND